MKAGDAVTMNQDNTTLEIISISPQNTIEIAKSIGRNLVEGDVLALSGELGSGKTCFTGGLAQGLDLNEKYQITSPTFTLINEYPARHKLYHLDVYRLSDCSEFDNLGCEEFLGVEGIVVIEWAEKIAKFLPSKTIFIYFEYVDEEQRKIIIEAPAAKLKELIKDI